MTHQDGCVIEHDPDIEECMTAEDLAYERALARAEALADEHGGWKNLR